MMMMKTILALACCSVAIANANTNTNVNVLPFIAFNFDTENTLKHKLDVATLLSALLRRSGVASKLSHSNWQNAPVDVFNVAQCAQLIPVHGVNAAEWDVDTQQQSLLATPTAAFYRDLVRAPDTVAARCDNTLHVGASAFASCIAVDRPQWSGAVDVVLVARELARFGLPVSCQSPRRCSVRNVAVDVDGDGWALFLDDLLTVMRTADASCTAGAERVLVTPVEHFAALDGAEQRSAGIILLRAMMLQGGARVARSLIGLTPQSPAHMTANVHVKRSSMAMASSMWALENYPLRAHVFHLLFWTVLFLILAVIFAIVVMHSLYRETEKDALLYRNTTSTMFANTLEMR